MTMHFEMSLGPVQGFVAQARRTRDLWGGSFLLSLLSGHAMAETVRQGATVVLPVLNADPLFEWIQDPDGPPPAVGSLPNHFVAEVTDIDHGRTVANRATEAILSQWGSIAEAVWDQYLGRLYATEATRRIWDRQISGFWNVRWVVHLPDEPATLARRKLWHTRWVADEPGDKCTVMHDYQELSGFIRSAGEASDQDAFWKTIQNQTGPYDLRDGEKLSAIALVKRLFPRLKADNLGWETPDVVHWPSTVHLGAQPWLKAIAATSPESADRLVEALKEANGDISLGRPVQIPGISNDAVRSLRSLDPGLWRRDAAHTSSAVLHAHDSLDEELGDDAPAVSQFYALLLADGDRLGHLVASGGGDAVSRALADFTASAPGIVSGCNGVTVYAGGDDVLAMLPVPDAMECADALSASYRDSFRNQEVQDATLSAGIAFAHVRLKLMDVLDAAHFLIDDVAKEGNGRDSLAVGVLKPGGLQAVWSSTWQWNGQSAIRRLQELVDLMESRGGGQRALSESAAHRIRSSLTLACGWPSWTPGRWAHFPVGLSGEELVLGILSHGDADADKEMSDRSGLIWEMAKRHPSPVASGSAVEIGIDSLVLASFLANGWQESIR